VQITVTYDRPDEGPRSGPVQVGWFLANDKAAVLYDPPERLVSRQVSRVHAKSASRCPAVIQMESRYFVIKCQGKGVLVDRAGTASPIRGNKLGEVLTLVSEVEWRFPDRPTVQLSLPYCFIADEPVWLTQIGTFAHYRRDPLPGTIFGGRFPLDVWPRHLMWAFEWHDTSQDLELKRGEPWFYCRFEHMDPSRPVKLIEAEMTPVLRDYVNSCSTVTNYVNRTFSLFDTARERRPEKLLTPKTR